MAGERVKSMGNEEIAKLVREGIPDAEVDVQGGGGKYTLRVVSDRFAGLGPVKRQQTVYRILNPHIASGAIHAVSMDLRTRAEAPR